MYEERFNDKDFNFYKPVIFLVHAEYGVYFTCDHDNRFTTEKVVQSIDSLVITDTVTFPILTEKKYFYLEKYDTQEENDVLWEEFFKYILDTYDQLHRDLPITENISEIVDTTFCINGIEYDKRKVICVPIDEKMDTLTWERLLKIAPTTMAGVKLYHGMRSKIVRALNNKQYTVIGKEQFIYWI